MLGESINKNVTVSLFRVHCMEGVPPCRTKQMEQAVHSSLTLRSTIDSSCGKKMYFLAINVKKEGGDLECGS